MGFHDVCRYDAPVASAALLPLLLLLLLAGTPLRALLFGRAAPPRVGGSQHGKALNVSARTLPEPLGSAMAAIWSISAEESGASPMEHNNSRTEGWEGGA